MRAEREFNDAELVPGTRYRVVRRIGVGGMGSVYEVEHLELGKRFVLKALQSIFAERDDLVQRLRNEWRALGRLEHPNIVSVTDAGTTANRIPYYVMERLNGETLAARLRRDRKLPLEEALRIAAEVADGLGAAHRIGIVHRDVKPPNVFLVAGGAGAKLLDFGIAKVLDSKAQITGRGVTLGTPRYMSPEQATGGEVDGRTDLYALGLLLFEMISGVGPFDDARDGDELFLSHVTKTPPPLSARAPGASKELIRLVAQLLEKKPSDRPSDASAVAALVRDLIPRGERHAVQWSEEDLATRPGGPFDTLEGADTAASDPQGFGRMARHREEERTATRTHPMSEPPSLRDATNRTVPLSEQPDDEPETRTSGGPRQRRPQSQALPEPLRYHGETPPPVESFHEVSGSRSAAWPPRTFGLTAGIALVGAALVVSGSYWVIRGRVPTVATDSTAASQPVGASEPSRTEPTSVPPSAPTPLQDPASADPAEAVAPAANAPAPPAQGGLSPRPQTTARVRAASRPAEGRPPGESTPAELPGAQTEAPVGSRRTMPSSGL